MSPYGNNDHKENENPLSSMDRNIGPDDRETIQTTEELLTLR